MRAKRRLFWQIYPSYLLITLLALVAVTLHARRTLRHLYLEQTSQDLEVRARIFGEEIRTYLEPLNQKAIDEAAKRIGSTASTRITVILPSGEVVGDSDHDPETMDSHADRLEFLQAMKRDRGESIRHSRTLQKDLMYVAVPARRENRVAAVIRASIPVSGVDETLRGMGTRIMLGGLLMAVFAAVLGLWVSRRITRPIQQIRLWAEAIARGEFQYRPAVRASEEIEALSISLGQMAEDLRKRIETTLRQRNEIEAVLSGMAEGVMALDMEERILNINQAAQRMLGTGLADIEGRSIQEIVRSRLLHQLVADTLHRSEQTERDIPMGGEGEVVVNCRGTALRDESGRQIGALFVMNDVTELRRLENVRREFVANVSHELKTPITAIKGFVETLREGAVKNPQDAERFLSIIDRHVGRLEAIVEDLLILSRIEQGAEKGEIHLVDSRIRDILQTAVQVCRIQADAKQIRVETDCPEEWRATVDPPLLEQAVVNLLDNAIKYSGDGDEVRIEVSRTDEEILISVRDHGCGIEKRHLSRLFERFYRVDKARSRQVGGTGLGLAIAKHIVMAHRGRLTVESTPGVGSVFTIHLPLDRSRQPTT